MAYLIGIAGGSGSGKTTLARALAQRLPGSIVIAEDDYYRCATTLQDFDAARHDFDAVTAKDMERMAADLSALKRGEDIEKPLYDYVTHTRRAQTQKVAPAGHIIVEGILALADARVRACYDLAVWLETPGDLCLLRRVRRDVAERGRTVQSVLDQYELNVRPAYLAHAPTQRDGADLVLDAEAMKHDLDAMVVAVCGRVPAA